MKVSFNGLRKGIARTYNQIAYDFLDPEKEKEDLSEAIESLRQYVATLIACTSDGNEEPFDSLEIDLIKINNDKDE
jgi:hypothetical protein